MCPMSGEGYRISPMRPDSLLRLCPYINRLLLTYLLLFAVRLTVIFNYERSISQDQYLR